MGAREVYPFELFTGDGPVKMGDRDVRFGRVSTPIAPPTLAAVPSDPAEAGDATPASAGAIVAPDEVPPSTGADAMSNHPSVGRD